MRPTPKHPVQSQQSFSTRPTVRVNLSAIKHNYTVLQKRIGNARIGASVKADAYGLGAGRVGRTLYGEGCRTFFVATTGEGKMLREAIGDNASIYVLNGPAPRDLNLFFGARLKPVLNSLPQAHLWAETTRGQKSPPACAVHVDTGMNRLGFDADEFTAFLADKSIQNALVIDHFMSHLACAPHTAHPLNAEQLKRFKHAAAQLPPMQMSLANSAGIFLGRGYHFQMVRPGIALYGGAATDTPKQEGTRAAISLMAPVLQLRRISKGETLGYDATYTAPYNMHVAVLSAGYADGIPVSASGPSHIKGGHGTLKGARVPIVGRVSMDLTIIDISHLETDVHIGDWVEFMGENLSADAERNTTINYELLARLGQRCRREYVKDD